MSIESIERHEDSLVKIVKGLVAAHLPGRHEEQWDLELLLDEVRAIFPDGQAIDLTPTYPVPVPEPAPTASD